MAWKTRRMHRSRHKFAAYHGTTRQFESFDLEKTTFGIHVGTLDQARSFIGVGGGRVLKMDVKIKNPLRMVDLGEWNTPDIMVQLAKNPKTADIQDPGFNYRGQEDWAYFRRELMKRGFDGIIYLNREEGIPREQRRAIDAVTTHKFAGYPSDDKIMQLAPAAHDSYIIFDPFDIVFEEEQRCWKTAEGTFECR